MEKKPKKLTIGSFITAFLVFGNGIGMVDTTTDFVIVTIVAVGSAFGYSWLKSKMKIKNETVKTIVAFVIIGFIAGFIDVFLTVLM